MQFETLNGPTHLSLNFFTLVFEKIVFELLVLETKLLFQSQPLEEDNKNPSMLEILYSFEHILS
jgi:hypothetical protein